MWWILALAACGSNPPAGLWPEPELPSCDVAFEQADDTEEAERCVARLSWPTECDEIPGDLSRDRAVFAGLLDEFSTWSERASSFTVTDASTWAELAEGLGGADALPGVDFETSVVAVAVGQFSSSCGAGIVDHGMSGRTLYASFEDSSGACAAHCDVSWTNVVAYAAPRESGLPQVCASVVNSCEP